MARKREVEPAPLPARPSSSMAGQRKHEPLASEPTSSSTSLDLPYAIEGMTRAQAKLLQKVMVESQKTHSQLLQDEQEEKERQERPKAKKPRKKRSRPIPNAAITFQPVQQVHYALRNRSSQEEAGPSHSDSRRVAKKGKMTKRPYDETEGDRSDDEDFIDEYPTTKRNKQSRTRAPVEPQVIVDSLSVKKTKDLRSRAPVKPQVIEDSISMKKTKDSLRKPRQVNAKAGPGPSTIANTNNARVRPSTPLRRSPRKGGTSSDAIIVGSDSSQVKASTPIPAEELLDQIDVAPLLSSPLTDAPSLLPASRAVSIQAQRSPSRGIDAGALFFQEWTKGIRADEAAAAAVQGPPSPSSSVDTQEGRFGRLGFDAYNVDFLAECLDEEEREVVRQNLDPTDHCPFCKEPLPNGMSPELIRLCDLYKPPPKDIRFDQKSVFCNAHLAESHTIPLGLHRGYPATIPWDDIWRNLEIPWIRERMKRIIEHPLSSPMFRSCTDFIKEQREKKAFRLDTLKQTMVFEAAPGYYGQLGAELIKDYLIELDKLRLQPFRPELFKPLTLEQFREYILVPEAATFLIMHHIFDYAPPSHGPESPDMYQSSYDQASTLRRQSVNYGRVMAERTPANEVKDPFLREKKDRHRILRKNWLGDRQKGRKRGRKQRREADQDETVEVEVQGESIPSQMSNGSTTNLERHVAGQPGIIAVPSSQLSEIEVAPYPLISGSATPLQELLGPPRAKKSKLQPTGPRRTSPRKIQPDSHTPTPTPTPAVPEIKPSQDSYDDFNPTSQDLAAADEVEAMMTANAQAAPEVVGTQSSYGDEITLGPGDIAELDHAEGCLEGEIVVEGP